MAHRHLELRSKLTQGIYDENSTCGLYAIFWAMVYGQENLFLPADEENWTTSLFVLFEEGSETKEEIIAAIEQNRRSDIAVEELRDQEIRTANELLPTARRESGDGAESARDRLGRYIVLDTTSKTAAERIARKLARRSDVIYVTVGSKPRLASGCGSISANPPLIQVSESKTWGFNMVRASSAWYYARGHSHIGVADFGGSDPNHNDLKPFNGNSYIKGNLHENLSIDIAHRFYVNSQGANPYVGQAFFGSIDEYMPSHHPTADANCDANGNGFLEMRWVGHGTAVTGVIGASAENSLGMKGVCRHCSIGLARWGANNYCALGNDPITGAYHEADPFELVKLESQIAAIGIMLDVGAQVVNLSGGVISYSGSFCSSSSGANHAYCLLLTYADDVDVPIIAAAGNVNATGMDFPAADNRTWGIAGLDPSGSRWNEFANCGSNKGTSSYKPHFAAPAVDIYTTMYPDVTYHPEVCHEYNDGAPGDGFGFCTGTSFAAPHISGIVGLLRSVNPLMSKNTLYNVLRANSSQSTRTAELGWGVPRADLAVKDALGVVDGVWGKNRATPLFELYSAVAEDYVHTTKPQMAVAFSRNITLDYQDVSTTPLVLGFNYAESTSNINSVQDARAAAFVLTTHRVPVGYPSVVPIYRMRFVGNYGGNPQNADAAIVLESEVGAFKSVGYNMEGLEGYIFSLCSPEPSCIPAGAEILYRAYHSNGDDHAVFLSSSQSAYQSQGYTINLTKLGYAFKNQNSDSDNLIDGFEIMLGMNPYSTDSDCDGQSDSSEYPFTGSPQSDPLRPAYCP